MKPIKANILLLPGLIGILFFTSCTKEDDNLIDQTQIEQSVHLGTWKISYFNDSGDDETNHFTGYIFTFDENNILLAVNGSITHTGIWNISDSSTRDDSADDVGFNIFFNLSNDFEDLNEDWDIISHTNNEIQLIHISGGNGGTDYLTFEKTI